MRRIANGVVERTLNPAPAGDTTSHHEPPMRASHWPRTFTYITLVYNDATQLTLFIMKSYRFKDFDDYSADYSNPTFIIAGR